MEPVLPAAAQRIHFAHTKTGLCAGKFRIRPEILEEAASPEYATAVLWREKYRMGRRTSGKMGDVGLNV